MTHITLSETENDGWVIGHKSEWIVDIPQDKIDWIRKVEAESKKVQAYLERVAQFDHAQRLITKRDLEWRKKKTK